MDHRLLEIIACPVCNGKLYYSQDKQELICKLDSLAFPLRDGSRCCWRQRRVRWR